MKKKNYLGMVGTKRQGFKGGFVFVVVVVVVGDYA